MFEAMKRSLAFPVSPGPFMGRCICPMSKLQGEYSIMLEVNYHLPKDARAIEQCTMLGEGSKQMEVCCGLRSCP